MFSIDWRQKLADLVIYAGRKYSFIESSKSLPFLFLSLATNPWQFLYYIFLFLTPMFLISGYLAYRLAKDIERSEKVKRAKIQQKLNIAKVRKHGKHE